MRLASTVSYVAHLVAPDGSLVALPYSNTNKLLSPSWQGIKTGINVKAGPCVSLVNGSYVIVILNSQSPDQRWKEAEQLSLYASRHY